MRVRIFKRTLIIAGGLLMLGVLCTALILTKLHWDDIRLEKVYSEVEIGASSQEVSDVLSGLSRSGRFLSTNGIALERCHYGMLSARYLLLVTQSNKVCHVSIRAWDRFDRVYSQKGAEVVYPGIPETGHL